MSACVDCGGPLQEGDLLCEACVATAAAVGLTWQERVAQLRLPVRRFYVAAHPDVSTVDLLLARQRSHTRFEDAFADMGEGVVFDDAGEIVAFHERHLRLLELRARRAARSGVEHVSRMSNTPPVAS